MNKLSLSLILIVLCATFALGWVIDRFVEVYAEDNSNDIIDHYQTLGQQIADSVGKSNDSKGLIEKWNSNGTNQVSMVSEQAFPLPVPLQQDFKLGKPLVLNNGNALSLHYYLVGQKKVLTFTPDELITNSKQSKLSLLLTSIFYIGIVVVIAIWLFPLIKRLNLLRDTAKQFGTGDFSQRLPISNTSYIADIETEFNRMADKIEALIADNKLISSAVSHDLKTPLARLRLGLDVIADNQAENHLIDQTSNKESRHNSATQAKYLKRLSNDIDEMQSLINVLIGYARLEQTLIKINKSRVSLNQIFNQLKRDYQSNDLNFDLLESCQQAFIDGDENYLNMLFHNILDNSFQHCQTRVMVEIVRKGKHIIIRVHDDGKGIPESERVDIVKPFIKSNSKGHGLGLAIVERIAFWHQAELIIGDSEILAGALMEIRFSQSASIQAP